MPEKPFADRVEGNQSQQVAEQDEEEHRPDVGDEAVRVLAQRGTGDLLAPRLGDDSLRYALLAVSMLGIWGAYHYYQAGRYYRDDLEKSGIESAAAATA